MSWQGKVLRVDLTAGTCTSEPLRMDWAADYIGQRGLGTKYLYEEIDPACDPLSPSNKLIIITGPLTGTMASTGGRWSVVTKGALTGAIACSNSGGQFGGELKLAGWDMVIFEGKSPKPVYLLIQDDQTQLIDGTKVWGRTVWEAEDHIKATHQDPLIRIASVGIAGEQMARFACVMNDRDRAAGRSGVGAVMGSKSLKAIAVRGTAGLKMENAKGFLSVVQEKREKLDQTTARNRLGAYGTLAMLDVTQAHGSLPTRNCHDVQFEGSDAVNVRAMLTTRKSDNQANLVRNKACFACSIGCGRVAKIAPDHFTLQGVGKEHYKGAMGGLEYESAYALGPMCGVDDIEACTYASALCNEHGMDPISFGASVAAAMELFEAGLVTLADTDGVALEFGNAKALTWAAEVTGTMQGFGREIGLGAKRLCEKYGRPEFSMDVKGQEFPGYDPRAMQGMGLAYATSNRGACHLRAEPYADDFQRVATDGKAEIVAHSQNQIAAIDSSGLCAFTSGPWGLQDFADQLNAALGTDWTDESLTELGERIWNLEKLFNMKAGLTAADDTLPERVRTEASKSGAGKGWVAELDQMLPAYYARRGWAADGTPTEATLQRLGLA